MRKYGLLFMISILIIIMGGCNELVTTDNLIGGKWVPKSGYKDGEASGESRCFYLNEGIEFKDEETVYVKKADKNFKYYLREWDVGTVITFYYPSGDSDIYEIMIENEENLALIGSGDSESFNCYFKREK